jgi:DNA-binding protein HU-beta
MTKADIVAEISEKTGVEKVAVQVTVEAFMNAIKSSLENGQNVYLRGFGSFIVKKKPDVIFLRIRQSLFLRIISLHSNLQKLSLRK